MTLKMGKSSRADIPERSCQAGSRLETGSRGSPATTGRQAGEGEEITACWLSLFVQEIITIDKIQSWQPPAPIIITEILRDFSPHIHFDKAGSGEQCRKTSIKSNTLR